MEAKKKLGELKKAWIDAKGNPICVPKLTARWMRFSIRLLKYSVKK
jgi:hypothetical protein